MAGSDNEFAWFVAPQEFQDRARETQNQHIEID